MATSLLLGTTTTVSASIISIVGDFFTHTTAEVASANVQTLPLLQASSSSDPDALKNDSGSPVVDGGALIAESGPVGTAADISPTAASDQISVYVVRAGDSLSTIASMYNVSPQTIIWANDLPKNAHVSEGQTLIILPISGVQYTVKAGDTLEGVAKKFKADSKEIAQFNDLENGQVLVKGSTIIVPDALGGEAEVTTPSKSATTKVAVKAKPKAKVTTVSEKADLAQIEPDGYKAPDSGYFMRPITGGRRTQGIHGHNGVDLASAFGANIMAAASGNVIVAREGGWNGGYGSYVVVEHSNGMQTLYAHLSSVSVSVGEHVSQGQVLGHMGSTGESTGVHLHFEVRGGVNPF